MFTRRTGGVLSQFLRFGLIGAGGFVVDVTVLYLALSLLGVGPYAGRVLSYLVAASFTWYLNRRITFADRRSDAAGREWGTFVLLNGVGGAINYATYAAFLHHFGPLSGAGSAAASWVPAVGVALGSLAGLVANFTLSRQVVFRKPRTASAGPSRHGSRERMPNGRAAIFRSIAARPWLCALLIFIVAEALRVAMALALPREIIWPDGHRYLRVAEELVHGYGFGSVSENQASVPTQPLLIAAVELLFGHSFLALRLFFATLGAATCVVGYLLAKELFGPAVALTAGALLAVYPYFIYLSALFEYPQVFFLLAMALAFWLLYRYLRTQRLSTLILAGLCLGVGILTVPTVLAFLPVLALCLLWIRIPRSLLSVGALLIATALPVAAWTARNYAAYGELILVNQAGGNNFWQANNETYFRYGKSAVEPPCGPRNAGSLYCEQLSGLESALRAEHLGAARSVSAEESASWEAGLAFLRASPVRAARLTVRKVLELWSPLPDAVTPIAGRVGAVRDWASVLSYVPVLLLALGGMLLERRETRRLLPIYGYLLTFTAVYSIFLPTTRYRLPLDFFLILFTACTLCRAAESIERRAGARFLMEA